MRWTILLILFLSGCATKAPQIYTSLQECPSHKRQDLGVYEVKLPPYFVDDRFVYKEGEYIGYLDERFSSDPQELLTRCAVRMLGGCLYPWECEKRPSKIVTIEIEDFYYDKEADRIVLSAFVDGKKKKIVSIVRKSVIKSALEAFRKLLQREIDLLQ